MKPVLSPPPLLPRTRGRHPGGDPEESGMEHTPGEVGWAGAVPASLDGQRNEMLAPDGSMVGNLEPQDTTPHQGRGDRRASRGLRCGGAAGRMRWRAAGSPRNRWRAPRVSRKVGVTRRPAGRGGGGRGVGGPCGMVGKGATAQQADKKGRGAKEWANRGGIDPPPGDQRGCSPNKRVREAYPSYRPPPPNLNSNGAGWLTPRTAPPPISTQGLKH